VVLVACIGTRSTGLERIYACAKTCTARTPGAIRSPAMADETIQAVEDDGDARGVALRLLVVLLLGIGIVALAAWIVGPRPKAADSGFPKAPPPLVLPSGTAKDSALGRAAALLAAGQLPGARAGFTDVVADAPDDVAGQVGLVLSRWKSTGPESVERDLNQLTLEYPDDALAFLHLGLVQELLGEQRAARATLRTTLDLGRAANDPTSRRMARLADDLLHPDAFQGVFPVLVQPSEVGSNADRASIRRLLDDVTADDHDAATTEATRLGRSTDAMARLAALAAQFDKDDPSATVDRMTALGARRDTPAQVRDRAAFLGALAALWGGGDRSSGCASLRASTSTQVDAATRRLATPIAAELCTSRSPA
jgi:hypothetical protein